MAAETHKGRVARVEWPITDLKELGRGATGIGFMVITGTGEIGDKAELLLRKTQRLGKIGFSTPPRVILAEDSFAGFFQRNGLGKGLRGVDRLDGLEHRIRNGSMPEEMLTTIRAVCQSLGEGPLAIRSSAKGDARGTGIYQTTFSNNSIPEVIKALQRVLASYFSEGAIAFRRDARTDEGFGIIIEHITGQKFGDALYGPVLSGFGYTSTSRGDSYVSIVPGLGGGVNSRLGQKVSKASMAQFGGKLFAYLDSEIDKIFRNGRGAIKETSLLNLDRYRNPSNPGSLSYPARLFNTDKGDVLDSELILNDDLKRRFKELDFTTFFAMINSMESLFGRPQYFEWAMTLDGEIPVLWMNQIAGINKKLDIVDFIDLGKIMFMGHTVTGMGVKELRDIVICRNQDDLDLLYRFNKGHRGYVLIFPSRLTTSTKTETRRLNYKDFSNASVLLEIADVSHEKSAVSHLGGQIELAGKFFAVLDYNAEITPNWGLFDAHRTEEDGLGICKGRVRVAASEGRDILAIGLID